jgi:hypothetical protein
MATVNEELEAILETFTPCPALSVQDLEGSFWRLFDSDGQLITPFMVLAPDGLIGNVASPSLEVWQIVNGQLCLTGSGGIPAIIFKIARSDAGQIITLAGHGTVDGRDALYMIHRVDHPAHPIHPTPPETDRRAHFLKSLPDGARRPNLVVVPAGQNSLHPYWLEHAQDYGRNWDLCIGYYGEETPDIATPHEYLAHIPRTKKFRLLYNLFYKDSPLWNYDAIWLPDDDLLTTLRNINQMFHLFRKFGLDLAQPSLMQGPGCFPNHPITVQQIGNDLRHTGFVEIMCPIFSPRALKICVGSMRDAESGYGLDHLWPAFLGHPVSRIGIIDAIPVAHTRPLGATYDVQSAIAEQTATHKAYQHDMRKIPGVW